MSRGCIFFPFKEHDVTKDSEAKDTTEQTDVSADQPTPDQPSEDEGSVAVRWPRIRHHKKIRLIKKLASLVL